jgi:hypothetical protein
MDSFGSKDWVALYGMSANQIQEGESQDQFVQKMQSQADAPEISDAGLVGSGQESMKANVYYWTQDVSFTESTATGEHGRYEASVLLVAQQGRWRFVTTSAPKSEG